MSRTLPATASAVAVLTIGAFVGAAHHFGPLSALMAIHIVLMNVVAPLGAALFVGNRGVGRPMPLWAVAVLQTALFWAWHAPVVQRHVMTSGLLHAAMHASFFVTAFCFWRALLRLAPESRWQGIPVLLLTGKLFCLLAVLLIFAPRLLYELPTNEHTSHANDLSTGLADQQLAGLLMVVACPLSYLIAGVVLAAQIISPASSEVPPRSVAAGS